jgi:hypothetical protein
MVERKRLPVAYLPSSSVDWIDCNSIIDGWRQDRADLLRCESELALLRSKIEALEARGEIENMARRITEGATIALIGVAVPTQIPAGTFAAMANIGFGVALAFSAVRDELRRQDTENQSTQRTHLSENSVFGCKDG